MTRPKPLKALIAALVLVLGLTSSARAQGLGPAIDGYRVASHPDLHAIDCRYPLAKSKAEFPYPEGYRECRPNDSTELAVQDGFLLRIDQYSTVPSEITTFAGAWNWARAAAARRYGDPDSVETTDFTGNNWLEAFWTRKGWEARLVVLWEGPRLRIHQYIERGD